MFMQEVDALFEEVWGASMEGNTSTGAVITEEIVDEEKSPIVEPTIVEPPDEDMFEYTTSEADDKDDDDV